MVIPTLRGFLSGESGPAYPYDSMERYTDGIDANALNRGFNWSAAYVGKDNPYGIKAYDNVESYTDGVEAGGLNNGTGWDNYYWVGKLATPTFSQSYLPNLPATISFATTDASASLYYTTDGSAPTGASTLFTAPFILSNTASVKVIAIQLGYNNSDTASLDLPSVHTVEVLDWLSRVQGQGSNVNNDTASAVDTFVLGLKSDGVWDKIKRLNIYVGNDLNALKAPLKNTIGNTTDTLNGFVASDYTQSLGLKGNTSTKYITTGVALNNAAMGDNDIHLSCYCRDGSNTSDCTMGAQDHTASDIILFVSYAGTSYFDSNQFSTGRIGVTDSAGTGMYIGSRSGSAAQGLYKNGSLFGSNTGAAGGRTAIALMVHCLNDNGSAYAPTARTLEMYSVGTGLSAADASNFTTRYSTLRTALGR